MKRSALLLPLIAGAVLFVPIIVGAATYHSSTSYQDAEKFSLPEAVAISALSQEAVLQGHPDGTYRPRDAVNRAEMTTIVMRLLYVLHEDRSDRDAPPMPCFPDVPSGAWYEFDVCDAKDWGIVRGDAIPGVPADQYRFAPARTVNYVEALKMLAHASNVPFEQYEHGGAWYEAYVDFAEAVGLDLPLPYDHPLDRGEIALLAASFYAYDRGELMELREAQSNQAGGSSRSSRISSSRSSTSSRSSGSSRSLGAMDPISDVSLRGRIVMLGTTTPILGSANVFSTAEPLDVTDITIQLSGDPVSIDHLLIYDSDKRLIGTARREDAGEYHLTVSSDLQIPQREDYSFYVRARLKADNAGGVGDELIQITSITVQGEGAFSTDPYTKTATGTFTTHETARSVITEISNAGAQNEPLLPGSTTEIARFRFAGEKSSGSADLRVTDLTFTVESVGVTLSNVRLGADSTSETMSCSVVSSTITCSNIAAMFGSLSSGPRTLRLFADISIASGTLNPSLRITLNESGTPTTAGAVTWTDGTTSFTWVGLESPVARGTYYSQ